MGEGKHNDLSLHQKFIKTFMTNKLKNKMFFFYQIIFSILIVLSPLIIIYRILKKKEDPKRILEKFGTPGKQKKGKNLIWFHGASIGEILSIIPIIKFYEKKRFIDQILVTSSTLSSSKVLKKYNFKKQFISFIL